MEYVTGTYGNHVIEGNEEDHKPVITIPEGSVLFNPDNTWNREKLAKLIELLKSL